MANWRVASSLLVLTAEVNAAAPRRGKASDGTIGDAAHSSRTSDHNPTSRGVVCAKDLTQDVARGADMTKLSRFLIAHPHPALKYLIWHRRIATRSRGFRWTAYAGANPHTSHLHVSVGPDPDDADSGLPWGAALAWRAPVRVRAGLKHPDVAFLQRLLHVRTGGTADAATVVAIKRYQTAQRLAPDGIAGPITWGRLL